MDLPLRWLVYFLEPGHYSGSESAFLFAQSKSFFPRRVRQASRFASRSFGVRPHTRMLSWMEVQPGRCANAAFTLSWNNSVAQKTDKKTRPLICVGLRVSGRYPCGVNHLLNCDLVP